MRGQLCRPLGRRAFVVALCASVFLVALQTRVRPFYSLKLPIKAFSDDYDRLKVKGEGDRSLHFIVDAAPAAQSIAISPPQPFPSFDFYGTASVEDVAIHLSCFMGFPGSVRPPPLR
jgi:hypothetical protein